MHRFSKYAIMELMVNIGYSQVLDIVSQLPKNDMQNLLKHLQSKVDITEKKTVFSKSQTSIQELIMQSPTWTDEDYNNYLEVKKHFHQSRLQ